MYHPSMQKSEFEKLIANVDNVIFDFGGIFLNLSRQDTINAFENASTKEIVSKYFGCVNQSELFSKLEVGKISEERFLSELKEVLKSEHNSSVLRNAWNAMLKDLPFERMDYLKDLSKRKRVFMLSNINIIHEKHIENYLQNDEHLKGFYDIFEKVYFSHHIGQRKPDEASFEIVLRENGLETKNTAFFDDTLGHVEAARSIGLLGIHLEIPNTFIVGR